MAEQHILAFGVPEEIVPYLPLDSGIGVDGVFRVPGAAHIAAVEVGLDIISHADVEFRDCGLA